MKVQPYADVTLEDVNVDGADKVKIRWLIAEKDKAANFAMRMFEVEPGGHTPYHQHAWEHEAFCVEGTGLFVTEDGEIPFAPGDVIYADPEMMHQFRNAGNTLMRFLCIVPIQKKAVKKPATPNPFASGKANNC